MSICEDDPGPGGDLSAGNAAEGNTEYTASENFNLPYGNQYATGGVENTGYSESYDGYGYQQMYTYVPHNPYQQQYPGYINEYGQFIPLQNQVGYHGYMNQGYHNNNQHYRGNRGGRRPRRGRGNYRGYDNYMHGNYTEHQDEYQYGYREYHHRNYEPVPSYDFETEDAGASESYSQNGAKPKQFSYQRNRYRENRQQRTNQPVHQTDDTAGGAYSQMRARHSTRGSHGSTKEPSAVEGDHQQSDDEDKTYSEKTHNLTETENIKDTLNRYSNRNQGPKRGNPKKFYTSDYQQRQDRSNRDISSRDKGDNDNSSNAVGGRQRGKYEKGFVNLKGAKDANSPRNERRSNSRRDITDGASAISDSIYNPDRLRDSKQTRQDREDTRHFGRGPGNNWRVDYTNLENNKFEASQKPNAENQQKPRFNNKKRFFKKGGEDVETQRGALIEQLGNNSYECMVCCDVIRRETAVWSCTNCYHVFHLRCVKKWAKSPAAAIEGRTGWRCPACQNVCAQMPTQYRCFCGRVKEPEHSRYDTPHSCGEPCRKKRAEHCIHLCNILCHPGPCPECQASVTRHCFCGKSQLTLKCSQSADVTCEEQCRKRLNCGRHECMRTCHKGPCEPCDQVVNQECYCGKEKREVICGTTESFTTTFCCEEPCKRKLACDHHMCDDVCHPGSCEPCRLLPQSVRYCACLKTPLDELTEPGEERKSCLDPIPTCDNICEKELKCGPKDSPHKCVKKCHTGDCAPCALETDIRCRCGVLHKQVPCADIAQYTGANEFRCDKRCSKKRECGRHRCQNTCCTEEEHKCDLICNKKLSCGLHRCEEPCHRGNCPKCWQVSFDELSCYCGAEVMLPPIPCGTRPPECRNACTRTHPCGHEARHPCHSEEHCPPCPQLTEKWCMGKHELRKNIACHLQDVSCGMRCNKPLACGHKCQLICHKDECDSNEKACTQPCPVVRESCGHPCALPCHGSNPCPPSQCRAQVTLTCECGNRSEKSTCQVESRNSQEYQRMAASMLAMNRLDGETIDISELTKNKKKARRLECSSDCAIKERNKRLAQALDIANPDISPNKAATTYTEYLKDYAKKNSTFCASVEKAMGDLVLMAQKSAHKSRSHSFTTMRGDQRKFIHELAEFYGCTTQSYDEEPQRNVVATAVKDKCHRPSVTLTALTQRELHPKAPTPIPHRSSEQQIRSTVQASNQSTQVLGPWGVSTPRAAGSTKPSTMTTLSKKSNAWSTDNNSPRDSPRETSGQKVTSSNPWSSGSRSTAEKTKPKEPVIDYFDMTD